MLKEEKQISIPSFNLKHQITNIGRELEECFAKVIEVGNFILGENVQELEKTIAHYCRVNYGIGVANGSDALYLSLLACEIGVGDEVITTPFTFFATAGAISRVGAKPVFVDIDPDTWNIDGNLIEKKITVNTKAIIPVHIYGCSADMAIINKIARKHNLWVIEDGAQAIGAKYQEQMVGSLGDMGCFSFFPTKNLGAFGDGGMIVTDDDGIGEKIKLLRVHGSKVKYHHHLLGCNSRLDELQAAILNVKFKYLEQWTLRRREIARVYHNLLIEHIDAGRIAIQLPQEPDYAYHVYHQYTIQTNQRDQLKKYLENKGVGSTVYYPIPMHLQKVFSSLGYSPGDFPIAETACQEVLSLPMFPELTNEEISYVVNQILGFFKNNKI